MLNAALVLMCALLAFAADLAAQCPTIKVIGPAGITAPGENVVFQAEISVVGPKLEYLWSIDRGTIVEGQGTTKITVFADPSLAGGTITATFDVAGLPEHCVGKASEVAGIDSVIGCGYPMDEWGEMKPNDQRGRLDVFFAELANNPKNVGVIVFRITSDDKLDSSNGRIQFVLKHAKFRKFDKSRIWFALELAEERSTRLYRIPPGADPPPCEGCLIFMGEHL